MSYELNSFSNSSNGDGITKIYRIIKSSYSDFTLLGTSRYNAGGDSFYDHTGLTPPSFTCSIPSLMIGNLYIEFLTDFVVKLFGVEVFRTRGGVFHIVTSDEYLAIIKDGACCLIWNDGVNVCVLGNNSYINNSSTTIKLLSVNVAITDENGFALKHKPPIIDATNGNKIVKNNGSPVTLPDDVWMLTANETSIADEYVCAKPSSQTFSLLFEQS